MTDDMQKRFSEALLMSKLEFDFETSSIAEVFIDSKGLSSSTGFNAYRGNWRSGLASALKEFYPTVECLVGDECFQALALEFSELNPSSGFDMNCYGEQFPEFVQSKIKELPYLRDMATLDWVWHRIFYCSDDLEINFSKIESSLEMDPDEIKFVPSKSLQLFQSEFPILKIWKLAQDWEDDDSDGDEGVDLDSGSSTLAIWRRGYERNLEEIEPSMKTFLECVIQEKSYGSIISDHFSELSQDQVAQMLGLCFQQGWICGIEELKT